MLGDHKCSEHELLLQSNFDMSVPFSNADLRICKKDKSDIDCQFNGKNSNP